MTSLRPPEVVGGPYGVFSLQGVEVTGLVVPVSGGHLFLRVGEEEVLLPQTGVIKVSPIRLIRHHRLAGSRFSSVNEIFSLGGI